MLITANQMLFFIFFYVFFFVEKDIKNNEQLDIEITLSLSEKNTSETTGNFPNVHVNVSSKVEQHCLHSKSSYEI